MPEFLMDKEGYLIDGEGNRIEVESEPIRVTNAQTQDQIDQRIEERLARQQKRISDLEAQANKTPELQKMLDDLKGERDQMERDLKNAQSAAAEEVAQQIANLQKKATDMEAALGAEREARVRDQVTNLILGKFGDRFINPAKDVVPDLLRVHRREPAKDAMGKTIDGQYVDLFNVSYTNEKGQQVIEPLTAEKALEALATQSDYQHYVRPTGTGGAGGVTFSKTTNAKRSEMSVAQKAEFVSKHGLEAYQSLPA